jgi:type I protein arginine methyltransferase
VGILAFFAARQGAKKVYALDHADIISAARQVAKFNNIKNVEFIQSHSKEFTLDTSVDVIIHEQMGNFLVDEFMVDNISDLRDRLLRKGGRIIPDTFELFIEPVKVVDSHHVPLIREMKIHGIDFSCLREKGAEELYSFIWRSDPASIDYFLCDPQPIYKFNLKTINPAEIPNAFNYSRIVRHAGRLDGFIVYFRCIFDDEIFLTTGPFHNRATNWKYWLLRIESRNFEEGDSLNFQLKAEDLQIPTTWQWSLG